jgi:hypothetical protein
MSVQVPKSAPSMQAIQTGKGQVANVDGSATPPGMTPPPPSAGTTGPKIATPSVDYNTQQNNRTPPKVVDAG